MDKALSDGNIKEAFGGKMKVIGYDEIHKYRSIHDLLSPYGAVVILYIWQDMPSYEGHWVCIKQMKDGTIIFFDPFGNYDKKILKDVSKSVSVRTNQDFAYLDDLLKSQDFYKVIYSTKKLQDDDSSTCGRWCCYFLRNIDKIGDIDKFNAMFSDNTKKNDKQIIELTRNYFK